MRCDEIVLRLLLSEAVSNARKYRDPEVPISLRAALLDGAWLEVEMGSTNRAGVAPLTDEQASRIPMLSPRISSSHLMPACLV